MQPTTSDDRAGLDGHTRHPKSEIRGEPPFLTVSGPLGTVVSQLSARELKWG
jgi:hypothetical protein